MEWNTVTLYWCKWGGVHKLVQFKNSKNTAPNRSYNTPEQLKHLIHLNVNEIHHLRLFIYLANFPTPEFYLF